MSRKHRSLLLVAALAIFAAQCGAQSPVEPSTVAAPEKFDVASIRPAPDRSGQPGWMGARVTGDRFEARSMSLESLIWYAYANGGPKPQTVSEGKGWIDSQQWDIIATVDDPSLASLSNVEQAERLRPLVRALLVERFHLKLHTEPRLTSVYALVQAKGGAKVKEVPAPPELKGDFTEALKRHYEENPGKPFPGSVSCTSDRCTAAAMKIGAAIGQIQYSSHADRMIVDETGLKGYYDFSFRQTRGDDDDAMAEVEQDLGVKFEPRKVNLTTYVIDSAEKPSAN